MNRREFLRLVRRGRERVLELSCERLYTRFVDAQAAAGMEQVAGELPAAAWEEGTGEPPLDVRVPSPEELLAELERGLAQADVLRVRGREWLAVEDFRRALEPRLEAFRRRGGRVE
ncbi:MAG TPA: hypothetical protein VFQ22_01995 [Longimicrobiales bacterium]|nr:hypothetical protein [Longimicrobiales bacterium]